MISVNLTSTLDRLPLCCHAVFSLVNQTLRPDRIVIWLSSEPYLRDRGISDIPSWVQLMNRIEPIVEVRWTANHGPYRKLLPALRESNAEDLVITADDDILYGEHWLERLVAARRENPKQVCAARVRRILRTPWGSLKSYMHWPVVSEEEVLQENVIVTFGGGAVLSRRDFSPDFLETDAYLKIAPTTDDLWFSAALACSTVAIHCVPGALSELNFIEHADGLARENMSGGRKDFSGRVKNKFLLWAGMLGAPICANDHYHRQVMEYWRRANFHHSKS